MGIADRAREAVRPTNSIEAVRAPDPAVPANLRRANPVEQSSRSTTRSAVNAQSSAGEKPPAYTTEPEAIAKAYYVEENGGERRYYDDYQKRSIAMRATETSVSSKREDLTTIKAMLAMAEARGWQQLEIKGTAQFKREAWIEAQTRGLDARGYSATDVDRQEADRRRGERGPSNELRSSASSVSAPASAAAAVALAAVPDTPKPGRDAPASASQAGPAERKGDLDKPTSGAKPGSFAKDEGSVPTLAANRKVVRDAQAELSPDGRLVLSALSEKVDRQMNKHNIEAKAQMKAFVATELVKKERTEGPVVLSAEQKRSATAAAPPRSVEVAPARRAEPDAPRRSLGR